MVFKRSNSHRCIIYKAKKDKCFNLVCSKILYETVYLVRIDLFFFLTMDYILEQHAIVIWILIAEGTAITAESFQLLLQ